MVGLLEPPTPAPKGPPVDRPTFGKRLKARRESRGLSRPELAQLTGINVRVIESWEQGRREPGAFDVPKLADALGCGTDDLIRDELPKSIGPFRRGRKKSD